MNAPLLNDSSTEARKRLERAAPQMLNALRTAESALYALGLPDELSAVGRKTVTEAALRKVRAAINVAKDGE